ncbi:MAG: hypothetical protein KAJ01_09410 [Candidatus Hydrogenedentes bacterium]|nr:hypothetical protein [Candidatus Hydrogenedentota bacterium]
MTDIIVDRHMEKKHNWRTILDEKKHGKETGRRVYQCQDCRQWKEEDIFASREMVGVFKSPDKFCPGAPNEKDESRVT